MDNQNKPPNKNQQNSFTHQNTTSNNLISSIAKSHVSKSNSKEYEEKTSQLLKRINCLYQNKLSNLLNKGQNNPINNEIDLNEQIILSSKLSSANNNSNLYNNKNLYSDRGENKDVIIKRKMAKYTGTKSINPTNKKTKKYIKKSKTNKSVEIEGTIKRNNTKSDDCNNNLNNNNINNLNCANNLCAADINNINNNYIKIHNARRNNTNVNKNLSFAKPKKKVIYLAIDTNINEHKNHISNLNSHLSSNLNSNLNSNMNSHINSISNSKGHTKINITDSFHYPKRNIIYNNLAINKNNNNSFNYELESINKDNFNFEQNIIPNQTPYEKLSSNSLVNNEDKEFPLNKDDQNSLLNGDCINDYNIEYNNEYNNELNDSKDKPIKVSIKKSRSFVKSKTVENTVNNTQGNDNSSINAGHNYINPKSNNKYKLSSNNSTTNFKSSSLYENKRYSKPKNGNYCIPKPSRSIPKNKKSRIISNIKNNFAKRKNRLNSIEVTNIDKGLELNISQELCEVNPNYANMKKKEINSFIYLIRKTILKYLVKNVPNQKSPLYNEVSLSERQKNYYNFSNAKNRYDDADAEEEQCVNQNNNGFVYNQNFTRKNSSSSSMKNLRNSKINIYLNSISNITENIKKINKTILYPNGNIGNMSHNAGITDRKNRNGNDRSVNIDGINNNSFYNGNQNLYDNDKGKDNLDNNLNINPNNICNNNKNEKIIKIKRNSFINKSKIKKDEINLTFLDEQKNYQVINKKMLSSDKCNESIKNKLNDNKIIDIKNSPITQRTSNTKNNTNQNTINKLNSNSNKTKNNIYPKKILNEKPNKSIIQKYFKGYKNNSCEKSNYQKTNQTNIKNTKNSRNSNKSTIFKGKNKSFQITSSRTKSPSNRKELVIQNKNLKGSNANGKRIESCPNESDNISVNTKKKNEKTYVSNNSKDDGAFSYKSSELNSKNKSKNKGMVSENSKSCLDSSRKDTNLNNNVNNLVIGNNNSHVIEYYEDYKNVNSFKNTKDNSTLEENKFLNGINNDASPYQVNKQIEKYERKIDEGDNKLKSKDNSKNSTLTNKSIQGSSNANSINVNYNKKNIKRKTVNKKTINNEINIKFDSHTEIKSLKKNITGHSHSKNTQGICKNSPNITFKEEILNNTVKSPTEINDLFNRIYQLIDTNNSTNTNTNPYIQAHKILNSEGELYNDLCLKAKISMDNEGNTEGDSNSNFINLGNNCNSNNKNCNKKQTGNNNYEMNLTSRQCLDHEHENNNDLENEVYSHEYIKSSPLELKQCMAMVYKNGYEKKHKNSIHNNSIINRSFKKTIFDGGENDACFRKGKNIKGKKNLEKDISFQSSNGNKIYEMLLKNKNNLNGKKNTSKNLKYEKEGINSYSGNNEVVILDKNNEYKDMMDSLHRLQNINNDVKQIESSLLAFIKKIKN